MATKPYRSGETIRKTREALVDDVGATSFAIFRNLVAASPVGNPSLWKNPVAPPGYTGGHFRRNWIVSFGGANESVISGTDPNGSTTIAQGRREIDAYQKTGKLRNIIIQNNVPYANRLAQGWSKQGEAGWVDLQIDLGLLLPGGSKEVP